MSSIRLNADLDDKLKNIAEIRKTTKSKIIKEALRNFFDKYYESASPYELGKDLFGKYGSGKGNLSVTYKKIIKEKIHAKHTH